MLRRRIVAAIAAASLLSACSIESLPGLAEEDRGSSSPAETGESPVDLRQTDEAPPASSVADVIEQVLPSVVNVRVRAERSDLFGTQEAEGQGSGVIIDPSGVILTNNHVVECAVEVEVVFSDSRRPVRGEVVGTVPEKDLAVLRVDEEDLEPIEMGRSSRLRLGDEVIALGFPLGLGGPTVTKGIVSGKDRQVDPQGGTPLDGLLQTDAAINPGNSGGALVDRSGRLVGINTAGASAGAAENVGFAIPIDAAVPTIEEILAGKKRAWLGVSISSVESSAIASQLDLDPDVRGAAIMEFLEGPAADSGLREGDVIVGVDDDEVRSADDLSAALARHEPGETVRIEVVRADGNQSFEVRLAPRPEQEC